MKIMTLQQNYKLLLATKSESLDFRLSEMSLHPDESSHCIIPFILSIKTQAELIFGYGSWNGGQLCEADSEVEDSGLLGMFYELS